MRGNNAIVGFVRKAATRILLLVSRKYTLVANSLDNDPIVDEFNDLHPLSKDLPEDVKEGHFVVYPVDDGELKRFIISLDYLAHPGFIKLLDLAGEEFGYKQARGLAVPCSSNELQRILENGR